MPLFGGPPNIAKLEARRDVGGLIRALGYGNPAQFGLRTAAAEALGRLGDARAVEPLIAALDAPRTLSLRRAAIATSLGQIGDPRAVDPLIAAMGAIGLNDVAPKQVNRDERLSLLAASTSALARIGDPRAVDPLIALLKIGARSMSSADWIEVFRRLAAAALVQIGDPRAVEPLIAALGDRDWDVRNTAATGLVAMYGAGRLNEAQRAAILAQRNVVTQPRTHGLVHDDWTGATDKCGYTSHHDANDRHGDEGIGIEFPI